MGTRLRVPQPHVFLQSLFRRLQTFPCQAQYGYLSYDSGRWHWVCTGTSLTRLLVTGIESDEPNVCFYIQVSAPFHSKACIGRNFGIMHPTRVSPAFLDRNCHYRDTLRRFVSARHSARGVSSKSDRSPSRAYIGNDCAISLVAAAPSVSSIELPSQP